MGWAVGAGLAFLMLLGMSVVCSIVIVLRLLASTRMSQLLIYALAGAGGLQPWLVFVWARHCDVGTRTVEIGWVGSLVVTLLSLGVAVFTTPKGGGCDCSRESSEQAGTDSVGGVPTRLPES